jgi:hypothetical protein
MSRRRCTARKDHGQPCGAAPLRDRPTCRFHDPELAEEVAAARRLGGIRRRRFTTIHGAYDLGDLGTRQGWLGVVETALLETLSLDNGIQRNRTILYAAGIGARLLDADLEERFSALERRFDAAQASWPTGPSLLDRKPDEG